MDRPTLDGVLALDLICLRDPTGGLLDSVTHRERLEASLGRSQLAGVTRHGQLVAYAYMWPLDSSRWFIGGLAIHPSHRNASVTADLLRTFARLIRDSSAAELHSHVLATNTASLRLHKRLGFKEVQRDPHSVAFMARVADIPMLAPT